MASVRAVVIGGIRTGFCSGTISASSAAPTGLCPDALRGGHGADADDPSSCHSPSSRGSKAPPPRRDAISWPHATSRSPRRQATFAVPGPVMGLVGATAMVEVSRLIGRRRATQMLLTGAPVSAATALEWGLVNAVVPPRELAAAQGRRAVEGEGLHPGEQFAGEGDDGAARSGSGSKSCSGRLRQAGVFRGPDPVLGAGAAAVPQLQVGQLAARPAGGGVGGERGDPPPVGVGDPQLRAGVRALLADDDPHPGRPAGQVEQAGQLGDHRALADLSRRRRRRRRPRRLGDPFAAGRAKSCRAG